MSDNSTALKQPTYFTPREHFKGISAAVLKIIAIGIMVVDHTAIAVIGQQVNIFRLIGRIAFPIFAYMIAQGAFRTRSIGKYMVRLGAFAVLSEVPFDMVIAGKWWDTENQNVYFTLLFGLIAVYCIDKFKEKHLGFLGIFTTVAMCAAGAFLKTDYGATGVVCIVLFYLTMQSHGAVRVLGVSVACASLMLLWYNNSVYFNAAEMWAILAVPFILTYNGEKGVNINKYIFYGFYPVHLLLLGLLKMFVLN